MLSAFYSRTSHIGTDIEQAIHALKQEELVAIPTETVYGLAANALSTWAVTRIFEAKNRPRFDPLIVHLGWSHQLDHYARHIPPMAHKLTKAFWPGPLTLLLPRRDNIPDLVTSGSDWVGLRVPDQPLTLELLRSLDFPLAAPSANPFGYISPTCAEHVEDQLGDQVAYILNGGPSRVGIESTIVGFPDGNPTVYRQGGVPVEELEAVIGPVTVRPISSSNPQAPGMLKSHYAPRKPFWLGEPAELLPQASTRKVGLITLQTRWPIIPAEQQIQLSSTGNLREAAQNLFGAMRRMDASGVEVIVAELMPATGLGRAMNDRLRRASAR